MARYGSCFAVVLAAGLGIGCGSSSAGTTDLPADAGGAGGGAGSGGSSAASGGGAGSGGASSASGGSTASGGAGGSGGASAGTGGADAGTGGAVADAGRDAEGGGCVTLTVKNYLSWCSVSVAGNAAASTAEQTACVAPGAVSLSATALTGFQLGTTPWHGTDGDHGSGELGTVAAGKSATKITVSKAACVWVCCEFTGGGGCPAANQCP
jgi:hypothetical protein